MQATPEQPTKEQPTKEQPTKKRTGRRPKLPGQDCYAEFYHRHKLTQTKRKVRLLKPFIPTSECVAVPTSLFPESPNITIPAEAKTYAKPGKPTRILVDCYIEQTIQTLSERDSNTLYYSLRESSDYAALRQFLALPPAVLYCLLLKQTMNKYGLGV